MKMFGELRLSRALTDEQIEIMRDPLRARAGEFATGGRFNSPPEAD